MQSWKVTVLPVLFLQVLSQPCLPHHVCDSSGVSGVPASTRRLTACPWWVSATRSRSSSVLQQAPLQDRILGPALSASTLSLGSWLSPALWEFLIVTPAASSHEQVGIPGKAAACGHWPGGIYLRKGLPY